MLKKVIGITVSSFTALALICSAAVAATDEALLREWYPDYDINEENVVKDGINARLFEDYNPSIGNHNITVSYESDIIYGIDKITTPIVSLVPIDKTDYDWDFDDGSVTKIVPNGFGYNWADVGMASSDITVVVDGEAVDFPDAEPFIDLNGRTMVPVRFISEALGADVSYDIYAASHGDYMYWNTPGRDLYTMMDDPEGIFVQVPVYIDEGDMIVNIERNGILVECNVGEDYIWIFGIDPEEANRKNEHNVPCKEVTLDTVSFIKDDRTYVPLRFISEAFEATVEWDNDTRTVTITSAE